MKRRTKRVAVVAGLVTENARLRASVADLQARLAVAETPSPITVSSDVDRAFVVAFDGISLRVRAKKATISPERKG